MKLPVSRLGSGPRTTALRQQLAPSATHGSDASNAGTQALGCKVKCNLEYELEMSWCKPSRIKRSSWCKAAT